MANGEAVKESSRDIRIGIAGAGFIADTHLRCLKAVPGTRVAATCDLDRDKARLLADRWGIPNAYGSLADMFAAGGVDVVHVLVPPTAHAAVIVECLEAGCDVFAEKPLAPNSAECGQIAAAAQRTGRQVGVNHNQSFHPGLLRLREAISDRRLGGIEQVNICLHTPLRQLSQGQFNHWMFREPGNIVLEQAPHPLSQLHSLLGPVKNASTSALERRMLGDNLFFETWNVNLECERGPAQCHFAFGKDQVDVSLCVIGQDSTAHLDLLRNTLTLTGKTRFMEPVDIMLNSLRRGKMLRRQAVRGLWEYGMGFLGLSPAGDTFTQGMLSSIRGFYSAYSRGERLPVGVTEGASVIEGCEKIIASAAPCWSGEGN